MTKERTAIPSQIDQPANRARKGLVLGMKRFVNFSAVEGMQLTPERSAMLKEMNVEGLTGEERQRAILNLMNKHI